MKTLERDSQCDGLHAGSLGSGRPLPWELGCEEHAMQSACRMEGWHQGENNARRAINKGGRMGEGTQDATACVQSVQSRLPGRFLERAKWVTMVLVERGRL